MGGPRDTREQSSSGCGGRAGAHVHRAARDSGEAGHLPPVRGPLRRHLLCSSPCRLRLAGEEGILRSTQEYSVVATELIFLQLLTNINVFFSQNVQMTFS